MAADVEATFEAFTGRRRADLVQRSLWTFDANAVGTRRLWRGGTATLAVNRGADFGGGTITFYAEVNIDGTLVDIVLAETAMQLDTEGKTIIDLGECQIWAELTGATSPDITAVVF